MSGAGSKLKRAAGFTDIPVPQGFDRGVPSTLTMEGGSLQKVPTKDSAETVTQHALELRKRMEKAVTTASKQKGNASASARTESQKALNQIAESVSRAATEYERSGADGGTIIADYAAALMMLDANQRADVLRRAGRPAVFESLLGGELEAPKTKPLKGGTGDEPSGIEGTKAKAELDVAVRDKQEAAGRAEFPLWQRPSANLIRASDGKDLTDVMQPKDKSPLDVKAKRGNRGGSGGLTEEDIAAGMSEAAESTRQSALRQLAGDQIAQFSAIVLKSAGYDEKTLARMSLKDKYALAEKLVQQSPGLMPTLPPVKGEPGSLERTLTVGAAPSPQAKWSGRGPASPSNRIDNVVARRNRSSYQKVFEAMDSIANEGVGSKKTINLDEYFPWWRARFGEVDASGNITWPDRLPSAEWLTGILQGMYGATDPDFTRKYLPIIARSIAAASDAPSTSRALAASKRVLRPSDELAKAMQAGAGSTDYRYSVYGDRVVPREPVAPQPFTAVTAPPAPAKPPKAGSALEKLRRIQGAREGAAPQPEAAKPAGKKESALEKLRRMQQGQKKPGTTDQSSIYTVPEFSLMQSLLA